MSQLFEKTVSALCYDLTRIQGPDLLPANDASRFVLRQHARMPQHLGRAIALATIALSLWSLVRAGGLFHRLEPDARNRVILGWKQSALEPFRDLIRFYESLVVMAVYSRNAS
jgi:hypothetical protein